GTRSPGRSSPGSDTADEDFSSAVSLSSCGYPDQPREVPGDGHGRL
ncbi:MAG: hypothetical protein AVDCRST_MAG70-853, partial [uncultured Thermomicrobiales bacterium]